MSHHAEVHGNPYAAPAEVGENVRTIIYARVSTLKQADAGNLERQQARLASYCLEKGYAIIASFSDIASGLNPHRRGLNKLFSLVQEKKVDCVVIEYQDRLARFGYEFTNDEASYGVHPTLLS